METKYSYLNYISRNKFYSGRKQSCKIINVDYNKGTCQLSNGRVYSISTIVDKVNSSALKLENPQILKSWQGFGNVKYYININYRLVFLQEGSEYTKKYQLKMLFDTEYDAMLCAIMFLFQDDSLNIGETHFYGFLKTVKEIVNKGFKSGYKKILIDKMHHTFNDTFKMKLNITKYKDIETIIQQYSRGRMDLDSMVYVNFEKLQEKEVENFVNNGYQIITDVNTFLKEIEESNME